MKLKRVLRGVALVLFATPMLMSSPCDLVDYGDGCYGFIGADGVGVLSDDIQYISDKYKEHGCMD